MGLRIGDTDETLFLAWREKGDPEALDALLERTTPFALALARSVSPRHAEDIVQETFLRVIRRARTFQPGMRIRPWLARIAVNAAKARARAEARRGRRENAAVDVPAEGSGAPGIGTAEAAERRAALRRAMAALAPELRVPLVMHYCQGLAQTDVAQILAISPRAVGQRLERALERLRRTLGSAGFAGLAAGGVAGLVVSLPEDPVPPALLGKVHRIANRAARGSFGGSGAASGLAKGGPVMKLVAGAVLAGALAGAVALSTGTRPSRPLPSGGPPKGRCLPPPPFEFKFWDGWMVEHVAFTLGQSGRPIGGPARWAVGGCLPKAAVPVDQEGKLYTGAKDGDAHMFFCDQRRRFWILEKGEIWPVAGSDDVGELDGPGPYARFIYTGVYGGQHPGIKASGHTLYAADNGWLRRIQRAEDGTWQVETVAGQGASRNIPPGGTKLADLGALGKGLALDPEGNLYFTMGGGLVKADPDGKAAWVVTREKVAQDFTALYAKKWPGAKVERTPALGQGEGVGLAWNPKGIYGGGRTWPQAWKVTFDGTFVPLVNYAPKDKLVEGKRWGPGDPGTYQVHCPMGFGVCEDGVVWMEHELPSARCRFEENVVKVLAKDYTWKALPWGTKDYLDYKNTNGMSVNGLCTMAVGNAPGRAFHGRTVYLRARREK